MLHGSRSREDVIAAVGARFPRADVERLLTLLDTYGVESYERERERVQVAIVNLSEGDEAKLREMLAVAKRDYRDVADWLTAFNVGLNDVQAAASSDGRVSYTIEYQRWAAYVLVLGATVGIVLMAILLMFDMRGYIARHRASRFPGLSTDQNMAIAWAMAVFWGFIWPWILIALHK